MNIVLYWIGYPIGRAFIFVLSLGKIRAGPFFSKTSYNRLGIKRAEKCLELEPEIVGYIGFFSGAYRRRNLEIDRGVIRDVEFFLSSDTQRH
jgi:hypothetical protein